MITHGTVHTRAESQPVHLECYRKGFSHLDGGGRDHKRPEKCWPSILQKFDKTFDTSWVNFLFPYQEAQFGQAR